jgi:hypothetical protein
VTVTWDQSAYAALFAEALVGPFVFDRRTPEQRILDQHLARARQHRAALALFRATGLTWEQASEIGDMHEWGARGEQEPW